MKILIYSYYYAPDPIGISKFTGETATWLAQRGHDVRVIAAPPHYPRQEITPGYSAGYSSQCLDGVLVLRCPVWISRKQSGSGRILQYLSFCLSSAPIILWQGFFWRPHVIFSVVPPISAIPAATSAAALAGARTWLHVQDFDIDIAFEMNFLRSGRMKRALSWIERKLMSSNRIVSSITPRMLERLRQKQVQARIVEFPNWADIEQIYPTAGAGGMRAELSIPADAFVALYSGNLGQKQGIDGLVEVARQVAHIPQIRIVIGGDGAGRARLADLAAGLSNLQLIALQPSSRLNELLNMADVHLLPQKANVADLVMPSKLGGMLASGRPVIAGATPGTQLAQEVSDRGLVVPPDDPVAMAEALLTLYGDTQRRARYGAAARERALEKWDKAGVLTAFEEKLLTI